MNVLVLNSGSSSIKYQLINVETREVLAKGLCERIALKEGTFIYKDVQGTLIEKKLELPNHDFAAQLIFDELFSEDKNFSVEAFGHRVVMGGWYFDDAVLIDDDVKAKILELAELAPLHNYPAHAVIEASMKIHPDVPSVAIFDTAFHTTIPAKSSDYALPRDIIEKYKIKRYGAHGISHRYVAEMTKKFFEGYEQLKILSAHIGNGASLCAISHGVSVNTTMGFTPLEGLVMGTRCGTIDPAIVTYVLENSDMTAHDFFELMNKKSGLLGLSNYSSDLRDIYFKSLEGDAQCRHAMEAYSDSIKQHIGSMVFSMGGCDVIAFTAGVGENSAQVRELALEGLEDLGIILNQDKNDNVDVSDGLIADISHFKSRVRILVVPTNEELMMAMDTKRILAEQTGD
ncbi:MAG: acetate kinase [Coriobacteriia bacterium]|nr:acetate kinase [Coriobacteriia bacterium]